MTKRITNPNLHRTPLEKEENRALKGYCSKPTNEVIYHPHAPSSANHVPASSACFPQIRNSSSCRAMHQKPPTGLPTISKKPSLKAATPSLKENVCSAPGIFHVNPVPISRDSETKSLPFLTSGDQSRKTSLISESTIRPNHRTFRNDGMPRQVDARFEYDNMMLGYFVPNAFAPRTESLKIANPSTIGEFQVSRSSKPHPFSFKSPTPTHAISTMHLDLLPSPPNSTNSPVSEPVCLSSESIQQDFTTHQLIQAQEGGASGYCPEHSVQTASQIALDVTPSGCTVLETETLTPSETDFDVLLGTLTTGTDYDDKFVFCGAEVNKTGTKSEMCVRDFHHRTSNFSHHTTFPSSSPTIDNSSTIPQNRTMKMMSAGFLPPQSSEIPSEAASVESDLAAQTISEQETKSSMSSWGRFSVLPPVMSSVTPTDGNTASFHSPSNNGQVGGMLHSSFSPLVATDFPSTMFTNSSRSSFSGRGSRNKRALSNSPLSAEGIDLNSIIRMSPTSLVTYLNGSRSSSSCVSPGSAGERSGCYGHLSARNSSSSPRSGSGSSGAKRSISHSSVSGLSHHNREAPSLSSDISLKHDLLELENHMILQAMQELEAGCGLEAMSSNDNQTFQHSTLVPECENLRILPQNMASYPLEEYLPYAPITAPSLQNYIEPIHEAQTIRQPSSASAHLLNKPPPTYAQHMARKATLEKKSSSDSSQPSNSNSSSFESNESGTGGGNSSTDSELLQQRMYECRWVDCSSVFHDLEEFVAHIEKQHMDQRKGEEFVCFWRNCPRRMHPFNQRYKLLMHMRVHSGDKPNKCTYAGCTKAFSRLENLKIHMRSHTGERPYSCPYQGCNKTFSNSSDRAKHQKTHQDMRPYICQVPGCGKRYTDPSSLRKHAKSSHAEKEPGRKKIRGGVEELDPKDLSECLVIKGLKPQYDVSPPERTDSGLGKSPRGSHLGFLSDHYTSFGTSAETSSRSGTALGSSNHTSPSSHHSSPRALSDISETEKSRQSNLSVPSLPPIIQSPQQRNLCQGVQAFSPVRPPSIATSSLSGGSTSSMLVKSPQSSPKTISIGNMTRELTKDPSSVYYINQNLHLGQDSNDDVLSDTFLDAFSRFEGVS